MIHVVVTVGERGEFTGCEVRGHSGYAPRGKDVVCAGVSALVQTALHALREVAGIDASAQARAGFLKFELPGSVPAEGREKAEVILRTMVLGLEKIRDVYPGRVRLEVSRR